MRNPVSRFAYAPVNLDMSRTRMNRTSTHKTTFNAGQLIPIYWDEVLPGDTYQMDVSSLVRMSTPIFPVMDNAYLDLYFFYVPNRLIWEHWKEFMGESPTDPYLENISYSVPQLVRPTGSGAKDIAHGSVLDYLGLPAGASVDSFNALPLRAYCKIWNDWFRDQNLMNAINFSTGDEDLEYVSEVYMPRSDEPESFTEYIESFHEETARGGLCAPVSKYHDYFTSALLQPQKGEPVGIPLNGFAPVYGIGYQTSLIAHEEGASVVDGDDNPLNMTFGNLYANLGATGNEELTGMNVYATINDLRYAFQIQKLLEADNRYGTRYIEIIKGHFGIDAPNAELQRAEFLGGKRVHINMQQVLQTSATDDTSPQGNTAAYSLTIDKGSEFVKSFTEHGIIMGVACVRTMHSYQQGLDRQFIRKDRYDYYFPELANISEQPIYNKEIYNAGGVEYNAARSNEIFGYQEPWPEYRFKPNRISGMFRSTYPGSLDSWHYGDFYEYQPMLSAEWIAENPFNIERTLATTTELADQFIADFYFDCRTTRIMPPYSIPGLADHH